MPKALIVEILADAKQFGHELDRAAGKTRQMGKVAGVAGLAIAGGLAVGLEKSVKAAMDAQVSTAKLDQAFKSSHDNIEKYSGAINQAETSGRNLGFTNTEMRDSLGSLEIATHSGTKAIRDLGIAEDIARFKHMDLASASKMLTMAMAGSQRATKALGLSVQAVTTAEDNVKARFKDHTTTAYAAALATAKLTDKSATSAQVIDLVSQKLHGQAQAFANTAQGGMAQMRAQLEALQENLGKTLIPALVAVTEALASATGWLAQHTTVAKIAVGALALLSSTLIGVSVATKLQIAAMALARAATVAWTAAQWLLNVALDANPIGAVIVAVAALGAALIYLQEKYHVITRAVDFLKDHLYVLLAVPVVGWALFVAGELIKHWTSVKSVVGAAIGAVTTAVDALKTAFNAVSGAVESVIKWLNKKMPIPDFSGVISAINAVIGVLKTLASWAEKAWGFVSRVLGSANNNFQNSPTGGGPRAPIPGPRHRHALGGIFTGPTLLGNDLFGEAGPEALIPLSSPQAQGMLGGHVTVSVGPVYGTVDADFTRKLSTQLATQLRNGGAPSLQQAIHAI